jgi:hypothetical protein
MNDIAERFADKLATWREHPAQMVRELFGVEPDPWQVEALERFPHSQRLCMKASKGVGKTAVEAWLIWNFLLTRPHPKVAATAITGPNLADNLWTELALWRSKSELLRSQFEWTKTRIFAKSAPETWWCSARTCPQNADKTQQANTLAGVAQHLPRSRPPYRDNCDSLRLVRSLARPASDTPSPRVASARGDFFEPSIRR